jgi:hypothetical protein
VARIPGTLRLRLATHGLDSPRFIRASDVVAHYGAVQAQDYLGSLWALGLRTQQTTEASVEEALARRELIRCWPMRGTLHFVTANDARWMTQLLAPRVIARHAARWKRDFDVDAQSTARARNVIVGALEGGKRLERPAIYELLESRRIRTAASRGLHLLLALAMEGTLCIAGRSGKQHTFALLDEWIPRSRLLERDAALAEIARRYFTGHGPATLADLAWWTGLTLREAKAAVAGAAPGLETFEHEGTGYWWVGGDARSKRRSTSVQLLPAYDEYTVGYAERAGLVDGNEPRSPMALLGPAILIDGKIAGSWKRTLSRTAVNVSIDAWRRLTAAEHKGIEAAADAYGKFLGLPARLGPRD